MDDIIGCFGSPINDRACYLCKRLDEQFYKSCLDEERRRKDLVSKLAEIKRKCPHRQQDWDEYTPYYVCRKDGSTLRRSSNECRPKLDCAVNLMLREEG